MHGSVGPFLRYRVDCLKHRASSGVYGIEQTTVMVYLFFSQINDD